jgi:hypothetical protein
MSKSRRFTPVLFGLLLLACGGPLKFQMASTPKAPGSDAKLVAAVHEEQHQTELEFEAKNLAPPERVSEGATAFVAWSRKSPDSVWARMGGLEYDSDSREAQLKGTVAETAFDFEITAEKSDGPASPSADVVFNQRVAAD